MMELALYLGSAGLVVIGALGIARAFSISDNFRMVFACLFAAAPVILGIWLFRASGLQVTDLDRLIRKAGAEMHRVSSSIEGAQQAQKREINQMDPELRREIKSTFFDK